MRPHVSDELIDQLVCGSLRGGDYRKAILALESEPRKWRDCALAFLQEQAIAQELSEIARSNVRWQNDGSSVVAETRQEPAAIAPIPIANDNRSWLVRLCSLAALLLVSFGVGWISSSIRGTSASAQIGDSTSDLAASGRSTKIPELKVDTMTVDQVLPKFGNEGNNYSFVGNNYSSIIPIDEEIPANIAKLEREGQIRVEKSTVLVPVESAGAMLLVPVQQLRVVPVRFSY